MEWNARQKQRFSDSIQDNLVALEEALIKAKIEAGVTVSMPPQSQVALNWAQTAHHLAETLKCLVEVS